MSTSSIRAGQAFWEIFAVDKTEKGIEDAKKKLTKFADEIGKIGAALTAVATAGLVGLGAAVKLFADLGGNLDDISQRTGVSASKLAAFGYAAEMAGASLQDVEAALRTMAKKGFNVKDFERIAAGIAAISDPSERAAKAMEVFGKSGTKLLPMFAELDKFAAEATWLGIVPTDADVKSAADLGDAFQRTQAALKATVFQVGAALAPAMEWLAEKIGDVIGFTNNFIKSNRGLVQVFGAVTAAALVLGFTLGGLGLAIKAVSITVGIAKTLWMGYTLAASLAAAANVALGASWLAALGPIGLVIALVGAAIVSFGILAAIIANQMSGDWLFRTLGLHLGQLLFIVKETIAGIFNAFASGNWELAGKIAMAGLKAAFTAGLYGLREIINTFAIWATKQLTRIFGDMFDMLRPFAAQIGIDLPSADRLSSAVQTGLKESIRQAKEDARKAMDELNRLNKEAKNALGGDGGGNKPPGDWVGKNPFGGSIKMPQSIQTTIRETDRALSSGAWSGYAAMNLSRSKPEFEIQERIHTELKEQTVLLKDLVENTEDGGAEFGE